MLLRSLTLSNVGVYRGRQQISFATSDARPITLLEGNNGTGKTSLLKALFLALYGKRVRWLFEGTSYSEYLSSLIHTSESSASIRLDFDLTRDGHCVRYALKRMWTRDDNGRTADRLYVTANGQARADMAAAWPEIVESIMPMAVANLAMFDGERIEALADPDSSSNVLHKSLYGLLGLDLVERLQSDLRSHRRRVARYASSADPDLTREALSRAEVAYSVACEEVDTLDQVLGDLEGAKLDLEAELRSAEDALSRTGGDLLTEREELHSELAEASTAAETSKYNLLRLASSELPISLVSDLLKSVVTAGEQSESARLRTEMHSAFVNRNEQLANKLVATLALGIQDARRVREVLQSDLSEIEQPLNPTFSPSVEATSTARELRSRRLRELEIAALRNVQQLANLEGDAAEIERKLAAVPDADAIADAVQRVATAEAEAQSAERALSRANTSLGEAKRRADRARRELDALAHHVLTTDASNRDRARVAREISTTCEVLDKFTHHIVEKHLHRITQNIELALAKLLRKSDLVTGIDIDAADLKISFLDSHGANIDARRLSAGERQIVATAVLWGLLQSANRDLPVVIDSPLGRLDKSHRSNLVESYFPYAARQVVLLSTDEEIAGEHLDELFPFVGAQYELDFDEYEACTSIQRSWREERQIT